MGLCIDKVHLLLSQLLPISICGGLIYRRRDWICHLMVEEKCYGLVGGAYKETLDVYRKYWSQFSKPTFPREEEKLNGFT